MLTKNFETHPYDKLYYSIKDIYIKAERRKNSVVRLEEISRHRYVTQPHMEISWSHIE